MRRTSRHCTSTSTSGSPSGCGSLLARGARADGRQDQSHRRRRRRRQCRQPHGRGRPRRRRVHRRQHRPAGAAAKRGAGQSADWRASCTKGLGAGADPNVGRAAALEDTDKILEALSGADMVFVTDRPRRRHRHRRGAGHREPRESDRRPDRRRRDQAVQVRRPEARPAGRGGPARTGRRRGHDDHDPERAPALDGPRAHDDVGSVRARQTTCCGRRFRASRTSSWCRASSTWTSRTSRRSCRAWASRSWAPASPPATTARASLPRRRFRARCSKTRRSTAPAAMEKDVFAEAFLISLLNPKVALFFLAFLPQFVDRDHGAIWSQTLVLGVIYIVLGLCSDTLYALIGARIGTRLSGRAARLRAS